MQNVLKVAFDVSSLFRRYRRYTGIPRYVRCLFLALSRTEGVNVLPYVNCTELGSRLDRPRLRAAVSRCAVAAFWGNQPAQGLELRQADVVHSTFYPPPQWLLNSVGPWVSTIHDLRPIDDPDSVEMRHIQLFTRLGRLVGERSTLVHCISRFTADRVCNLWGIPESRVRVIYPSISVSPKVATRKLPVLGDERYLLFLGSVQPAKGLDIAIGAAAAIRRRAAFRNIRIVVAGSDLSFEPKGLLWNRWSKAGVAVRMTRVGEAKKRSLIQWASAVLCTSRYEGFGFVPLEAILLASPPVVSTAHPCLETIADWPYRFASGDSQACASATLEVLSDPARARGCAAVVGKHISDYSWASAAAAFVELYHEVRADLAPSTAI